MSYLDFVRDISVKPPSMESIPVVREFVDVFFTDLPRVPPNQDIDFAIDVELDTKTISIPAFESIETTNRSSI